MDGRVHSIQERQRDCHPAPRGQARVVRVSQRLDAAPARGPAHDGLLPGELDPPITMVVAVVVVVVVVVVVRLFLFLLITPPDKCSNIVTSMELAAK